MKKTKFILCYIYKKNIDWEEYNKIEEAKKNEKILNNFGLKTKTFKYEYNENEARIEKF